MSQIFFRFYGKLAGMTGTATPAAAEFFELYRLKVWCSFMLSAWAGSDTVAAIKGSRDGWLVKDFWPRLSRVSSPFTTYVRGGGTS